MKITSKQLKRIIKEELEHVLNEGALSYAQDQLGTAGRHNPWLKSFGGLQYLSGPEDSLTNWISQAENSNDRDAKEALNKVRQLMAQYKQDEHADAPMTEQEDAKKEIELALKAAEGISNKLTKELEGIAKKAGIDASMLSTLIAQLTADKVG